MPPQSSSDIRNAVSIMPRPTPSWRRKRKPHGTRDFLAIICIGETQSQRLNGKALSVCGDQIAGSVPDGITASAIAIGYEPLWAIGTGHMPTSEEITEMHAHIRQCLVARFGGQGNEARILYGGSVNPSNAQRHPGAPRSWRRAGRRSKPEGGGLRGNFPGCLGDGLNARPQKIPCLLHLRYSSTVSKNSK